MASALLSGCEGEAAPWMERSPPEPERFAEEVFASGDRDYAITFTPDGTEAYFTRRPRRGPARILTSRFVDGAWTPPEMAPFSVERDEAPFISADGSQLLFSSRRAMRGSWDRSENLWRVERDDDGWGEPRPLTGQVNLPRSEIDEYTVGEETTPYLTPEGWLLYASRASPDWASDIYVARPDGEGGFVDPRPLRLNSRGEERHAVMTPDGRHIVFEAYRDASGQGDRDLYTSRRTEYGWSDPELLPEPINSPRYDGHPSFSPDGRLFFFSSDRGRRRGDLDIFVVDVEALGLER